MLINCDLKEGEILRLFHAKLQNLITELGDQMGYVKVGNKEEKKDENSKNSWDYRNEPVIEGKYNESFQYRNKFGKTAHGHKVFVNNEEVLVFGNRELDFLIMKEDGGFQEGDGIKIEWKGQDEETKEHKWEVWRDVLLKK